MAEPIKVGDTLWFVQSGRWRHVHEPQPVEITKVGRDWIYFEHGYRADKRTLIVDGAGYSSPGKLWRSLDDYRRAAADDLAWDALRATIRDCYSRPPHMSAERSAAIQAEMFPKKESPDGS